MAIFKLVQKDGGIENAELVEAAKTTLDMERHLECWLEQSPWAIAQEPLMVVGRQTTANFEEKAIFPDLLAVDSEGNLVIVELKRGRAPREVIAQILEYASWADTLSGETIGEMAETYFALTNPGPGVSLDAAFRETFEADEIPVYNQKLRLFIAAEEIPLPVARVARFLRTSHGMDISCVQFSVYKTDAGEILVSSEMVVGAEEAKTSKRVPPSGTTDRWHGEKPVKEVVWEAVSRFTNGNPGAIFAPRDIAEEIFKSYPGFNRTTVTCQITSDCVNHPSRHHYPGGADRYWRVDKGKYRLYNPETDKF